MIISKTNSIRLETKSEPEDVETALAAMTATFNLKMAGFTTDLKAANDNATAAVKRADALELKLNRPRTAANDNEPSNETKSFGVYLRRGDKNADETKTLRVSAAPQGGYLAPPEFTTEFIRDLVQFSPIRALATVKQTSHPSVILQRRTGITNALWKGEAAAQEGSEPTFGQVEVVVREVNTFVDISNQLLQDAVVDVDAEVRLALAEDFGQKEGLAFVKGDGIIQPAGLMVDAGVGYVPNTSATVLSADALITLVYSLPAFYRNRGTFLMNGTTLATVRKLKDSTGQYLWQPSLQAGQPETLLGRPVVEAIDMDDIAANAFPILFGDIASAYRIVDRIDLSVLVNPYLLATNSITRMHASRRVGSGVVKPAAIKKLKMSTT
ncbi:phage major capsid protein [Tardiphaga sp. vice352]|uniref:phage major capsid protein n=1 Tax=Tardiphaga sp. vice352 TaxID=2592816 RepID=UPI001162419D|nr:phage major capsid protein [Tardiphaga sp. vice352]QDM32247.1 phage major capsid protein [Tardiphaga sp. vice352]